MSPQTTALTADVAQNSQLHLEMHHSVSISQLEEPVAQKMGGVAVLALSAIVWVVLYKEHHKINTKVV